MKPWLWTAVLLLAILALLPLLVEPVSAPVTAPVPKGARLVVVFGGDHASEADTALLCEALPGLSKLGFHTLCMELGTDIQGAVDKYLASPRDAAAKIDFVLDRLALAAHQERTAYMKQLGLVRSKIGPEKVAAIEPELRLCLAMLDAAGEGGMSVRLVDNPHRDDTGLDAEAGRRATVASVPARNAYMAHQIAEGAYPEPGVVLVVGGLHLGHGAEGVTVDDQLAKAGFNTLSFVAPGTAKNLATDFAPWTRRGDRRFFGFSRSHADCVPNSAQEVLQRVAAKLAE